MPDDYTKLANKFRELRKTKYEELINRFQDNEDGAQKSYQIMLEKTRDFWKALTIDDLRTAEEVLKEITKL